MPWRQTDEQLIRRGSILEIVGIVLLAITVLVHNPLLMVILLPLGALVVLLGWVAWAWAFMRSL
jgi:hypothetical protein